MYKRQHTGIGSTMAIEGFNEPVIAFISNDYLGMSQREETKQDVYKRQDF